jgi:hypothetical protein
MSQKFQEMSSVPTYTLIEPKFELYQKDSPGPFLKDIRLQAQGQHVVLYDSAEVTPLVLAFSEVLDISAEGVFHQQGSFFLLFSHHGLPTLPSKKIDTSLWDMIVEMQERFPVGGNQKVVSNSTYTINLETLCRQFPQTNDIKISLKTFLQAFPLPHERVERLTIIAPHVPALFVCLAITILRSYGEHILLKIDEEPVTLFS